MRVPRIVVFLGALASPALCAAREPVMTLPSEHLEIALRVAGAGLPACSSYLADGSVQACLPKFAVKGGGRVNGWSFGGRITFTQGAIQKLTNDEFAVLAGHEIAHWYLGHNGSSPRAELEADKLGIDLACKAGFNVSAGLGLFRHIRSNRSHGSANIRIEAAQAAQCPGGQPRQGGRQLLAAHPLPSQVQF